MRIDLRRFAVSLIVCVAAGQGQQSGVTVSGRMMSCRSASRIHHPVGIETYVFDATRVPELLGFIATMRKPEVRNDSRKSFDIYDQMIGTVAKTTPLAHGVSDQRGRFKVEIPRVDRILVFGYTLSIDEPLLWAAREVRIVGRKDAYVTLDFTPLDHCGNN